MAWIRTIDPEAATGRLRNVYERIRARRGNIPNVARVQSLRPATMDAGFSLYCQVMDDPTGLSFRDRVLIATVVSRFNGCDY